MNIFFWWHGPWFLYCIFIFFLSSLSNPPDILTFPLADKIRHALLYSVLAILTLRAFRKWPGELSRWHYFIWAMFFCIFYGASDEWHQSFVANRNPDMLDWVSDVIGISIGGIIYWKYHKIKRNII